MSKTRKATCKALRKEGKTYKEIGDMLGIAVGTVGYYLHKAGLTKRKYTKKPSFDIPSISIEDIEKQAREILAAEREANTGLYLHLSDGTKVKYDLVKEALNLE